MFHPFRSVKMASVTNICFILFLCFIFVSNVKSEQPPNENTHTINMTCDAYQTYKLRNYQRDRDYRYTLGEKMRSLLTCNFTLTDVKIQADVLFSLKKGDESGIADTLWDVLDSKLEAIVSPHIFENMDSLSYAPMDIYHWSTQEYLINLMFEKFSLSGFPQVELHFGVITDIAPVQKVESEQPTRPSENLPTINMACKHHFSNKLEEYKSSFEYKSLLNGRLSELLTCNFTVADVEFHADVLFLGHHNIMPYFRWTSDAVLNSKMKTKVSSDVFDAMDMITHPKLCKMTREAYVWRLLNMAQSQPLLLTGFPQVELYLANITQMRKVEPAQPTQTCGDTPPICPPCKEQSSGDYERGSDYKKELFDNITEVTPAEKVESENFKLTCKDNNDLLNVISLLAFRNNSEFMKLFEKGNYIGNVSLDSFIASKFSFSNCAISTDTDGQKDSTDQQKPSIEISLDDVSQVMNFLKLFNTTVKSAENVKPEVPFFFCVLTFVRNILKFVMHVCFLLLLYLFWHFLSLSRLFF